jgi:hypothetical protein
MRHAKSNVEMKWLLLRLRTLLNWNGNLKYEDKQTADLLAKIAPLVVNGAIKLNKTRAAQSVSGRGAGDRAVAKTKRI